MPGERKRPTRRGAARLRPKSLPPPPTVSNAKTLLVLSILATLKPAAPGRRRRFRFSTTTSSVAEATIASPHPFKETQPDGTLTSLLVAHGGPRFHYLTDLDGYAVAAIPGDDDDDDDGDDEDDEDDDAEKDVDPAVGGGGVSGEGEGSQVASSIPRKIPKKRRWVVYARTDIAGGSMIPVSNLRVGSVNPRKVGLLKRVSAEDEGRAEMALRSGLQSIRSEAGGIMGGDPEEDDDIRWGVAGFLRDGYSGSEAEAEIGNKRLLRGRTGVRGVNRGGNRAIARLPIKEDLTRGIIRSLVVLIRFSDHTHRSLPSSSDIDKILNAQGGDRKVAPTGSVRDYFLSSSYGALDLQSTVMPWITLSKTEGYYAHGTSGTSAKFQEAVVEALSQIDPSVFDSTYDKNEDGILDAVMVMHSGYGAEWGKTDCDGAVTEDRIWAHKWRLDDAWPAEGIGPGNSLKVKQYHTNSAFWSTCGSDIARIGTIAHEIGHILGLPDMYGGGCGIGTFGLMGNSWGFDDSQRYPPSLSAWSKIVLGWVKPIILASSGTYEIEATQTSSDGAIYVLFDGYPEGEYLLIENRQAIQFDEVMPQGGLLIWHVDETAPFILNTGYPEQEGWPENGNHYRVALLQADGGYELEVGLDRGDAEDVWHAYGPRSDIGPSSSDVGPYPNTDAYQGGKIVRTHHRILNISPSGPTMEFDLHFRGTPPSLKTQLDRTPDRTSAIQSDLSSESDSGVLTDYKELASIMAGGSGGYGSIMDLTNKSVRTVTIRGLDVHTRAKTSAVPEIDGVPIHVWVKSGAHNDGARSDAASVDDSSEWVRVCDARIRAMGHMARSRILDKDFAPVDMAPGQTMAIYVSMETPDLRYTVGKDGDTNPVAENEDLRIEPGGSGVGSFKQLGSLTAPRIFNGFVRYTVEEGGKGSAAADSATNTKDHPSVENESSDSSATNDKSGNTLNEVESLTTTYEGGEGGYGSIVKVFAGKDLTITGIDAHVETTDSVYVEVLSLQGDYDGQETHPSSWDNVFSGTVAGKGSGVPTPLVATDATFAPMAMKTGEIRSFYVTLPSPDLRFTNSAKVPSVIRTQNGALAIDPAGAGVVGKRFSGDIIEPRCFNGSFRYILSKEVGSPPDAQTPSTYLDTKKKTKRGRVKLGG